MTTDEGDVVLDPFLGTGTSAIAAKNLNRRYLGIELDPFYVDIAEGKLAKIKQPTRYQGVAVSLYLGRIQSIRDCDATNLFPKQLTSTEKKRRKAKAPKSESSIEIPLLL
jgi:site-specific DNA-methyltransferase (adenine-specific)